MQLPPPPLCCPSPPLPLESTSVFSTYVSLLLLCLLFQLELVSMFLLRTGHSKWNLIILWGFGLKSIYDWNYQVFKPSVGLSFIKSP